MINSKEKDYSVQALPSRYFIGWNMVAAAFVVNAIAVGFFFYSYGIFLKILSAEFSASRLEISMGLTLSHVIGSLFAPFLGRAIDKYPLKNVMSLGTLSVVAGFVAISMAQSLFQFYLAVALFVAVGTSAMGMQSSVKLVANWFIAKRGTALGIATMGTSLAGILMPPITTALIELIGWRNTFVAFAGFTFFIILPLIRFVVIDKPEKLGLQPDGDGYHGGDYLAIKAEDSLAEMDSASDNLSEKNKSNKYSFRDSVSSFKLWNIVIVFGFLHGTLGAILIHIVAYATDLGISSYQAAFYLSMSALTGIFSKVVFGWLSDQFDVRLPVLLVIGFMATGILVLTFEPNSWQLAAAILVFGIGSGGVAPLRNSVISKAYGRMNVASAAGVVRLFTLPMVLLGAPFTGWIFDSQGSYIYAFYFLLAGLFISAVFTVFLKLIDVDKQSMSFKEQEAFQL